MIGSHDTFTYLKSTSWIYNNCKKYWKTQCKTIEEQYAFGIRFFDIRVCYDKGRWIACHGKVNLKMSFDTIQEICVYMSLNFPKAIYRIVLEKGDSEVEHIFKLQSAYLCMEHNNLWRIDIKSSKKWVGLVDNNNVSLEAQGYKFACLDTWVSPAHELHGSITASNFYKTNLKKEAQKINGSLEFFKDPQKLKNMIESKDELYFIDYCTNKY